MSSLSNRFLRIASLYPYSSRNVPEPLGLAFPSLNWLTARLDATPAHQDRDRIVG
jgi:hypothetical protein